MPAAQESEVSQVLDLSVIRYSRVWEDHVILEKGLDIKAEEDDILSIASSGDNVLNLLLARPRSITAIDMSPSQNHLVHLKLAAIRHYTHSQFVTLLGEDVGTADERIALYEAIRDKLPQDTCQYWDANRETVRVGIAQSGRLEKFFYGFQDELKSIWSDEVVSEMLKSGPKEASELLAKHGAEGGAFQKMFLWYFGAEMIKKRGRSEAQMKYVDDSMVDAQMWNNFKRIVENCDVSSNVYFHRWISKDVPVSLGPAYLLEENFEKLKGLVDRVKVVTDTIEHHLAECEKGAYSKANLSDIFEYMSEDIAHNLFTFLAQHFRKGGRLAYWNLFIPRSPAPEDKTLRVMKDISVKLQKEDRVFFYSNFEVAEVL